MSVSDGQRVNAAVTNAAFISRTTDSDTVAVVGLKNPGSGGDITNTQQTINDNSANIASNDTDIATLQADKEDKAQKGVADGYASLDSGGKVPLTQIPDKFASIEGNWDASTNTPTLADGVGNLGQIYVVDVAGTQDLGSGSQTFDVGDWVIYNSSNIWVKTINSTAVTSVNGETGAVSLGIDDLTDVDTTTAPPLTGQALVWDGAEWTPGTGAGGSGVGGISYIINADAEIDAANHTAYADGAVSEPVDGTGGSPSIAVVQTNTAIEVLRGTGSFKILKPASDVQGEGIHIGLDPIDSRDVEQRLQVSFDYKMISPFNTLDGDWKVFVYDVDNLSLIGAVENDDNGDILNHEGDGASFIGFFNATDSLNYRLLIHHTTTDVNVKNFVYDNVKLGPIDSFVPVVPMTEWKQYTPTLTNVSGTAVGAWRRIGDSMQLRGRVDVTSVSGAFTVSMPSGYTADVTKYPGADIINYFYGHGTAYDASLNDSYNLNMFVDSGGTNVQGYAEGVGAVTTAVPHTWASGDYFNFDITVPIVGWTAGNIVSNTELTQATTRASMRLSANQLITTTANTLIEFDTIDFDTHGQADTANNRFVVARSGYYKVSLLINSTSVTADDQIIFDIKRNGSQISRSVDRSVVSDTTATINRTFYFDKGDLITSTIQTSTDISYAIRGSNDSYFQIESLPNFTSYGVANPNTEYLEIETSSFLSSAGVTSATWVVPSAGFFLPLTPGTWDLEFLGPVQGFSAAGNFYYEIALATSSTPGTGIIAQNLASQPGTTASTDRYSMAVAKKGEFTITDPTNVYIHMRPINIGGLTTATIGYGQTGGSQAKLFARRIK